MPKAMISAELIVARDTFENVKRTHLKSESYSVVEKSWETVVFDDESQSNKVWIAKIIFIASIDILESALGSGKCRGNIRSRKECHV